MKPLKITLNHTLQKIEYLRSCLTWTFWWSWSSLDDLVSSCHFLFYWFLEGFGTYPRMLLHHTVFTDIDSMFKTKLISYSPFGTLAQSHFYAFCFLPTILVFLCDVTQFWQFSAAKQSDCKTIPRPNDNKIQLFFIFRIQFLAEFQFLSILIREMNWILWINFMLEIFGKKFGKNLPKINQNKLLLWLAVNMTEKFWNGQKLTFLFNELF